MSIAQKPHTVPEPRSSPSPVRSTDPRHVLGRLGEELAAAHFARLGFAILTRNARTRYGEIDMVAFDGAALVFVEVKTCRASARAIRLASTAHDPLERLRPRQQARVRRLAAAWLCERRPDRPLAREIRFDAVGVTVDAHDRLLRLDHLEAAW
ncbi:MAG TPA: YraN family protein [Solirubrobacteraceae bacterium]|nr:YraN family protein [Solirubrobacteraceae bacterium]